MAESNQTQNRKLDHIKICLTEPVNFDKTAGMDRYDFLPNNFPEISMEKICVSLKFFGKNISAPIYISGMIGGVKEAEKINRSLATAAQAAGIAMSVGSMRAALEKPETRSTYQVREVAPDIFLMANIGAAQLPEYSVSQIQSLVDMIDADALAIHVNPAQEAVQKDGTKNWEKILDKIENVCSAISVPVIAKEVGCGIAGPSAKKLKERGVKCIDVAGAGGTSWVKVEYYRGNDIAKSFWEWGLPTAECLKQCKSIGLPLLASGGIRTGTDIAKCIALGAEMGGMARPFLEQAVHGWEKTKEFIDKLKLELKTTMFLTGCKNIQELKKAELVEKK